MLLLNAPHNPRLEVMATTNTRLTSRCSEYCPSPCSKLELTLDNMA